MMAAGRSRNSNRWSLHDGTGVVLADHIQRRCARQIAPEHDAEARERSHLGQVEALPRIRASREIVGVDASQASHHSDGIHAVA
jgi:hypothetical protein